MFRPEQHRTNCHSWSFCRLAIMLTEQKALVSARARAHLSLTHSHTHKIGAILLAVRFMVVLLHYLMQTYSDIRVFFPLF